MKTLTVLFLITSFISSTAVIANEFTNISSKDPNTQDISVDKLVNYNCGRSGYFNPVVCEDDVNRCYNRYQFPKTVSVDMKLDVMNECVRKYIR